MSTSLDQLKEEILTTSELELKRKKEEAKKALKSQNYFRAIDLFTDLLVDSSLDIEHLIGRSNAYSGIGSYKLAVIDAKIALNLDSHNVLALYALSRSYYGLGDFVKAQEVATTALNIDAKNQKMLDLYQLINRRLSGDHSDSLDTVNWLKRDETGKIINQEHDHSHSHDHNHDSDHDHSHSHDYKHGSDHDHDHKHYNNHDHSHVHDEKEHSHDHYQNDQSHNHDDEPKRSFRHEHDHDHDDNKSSK